MRKSFILTVVVLFLSMGSAGADDWYSTNQATIRWGAVTTLSNGEPVPVDNVVTYSVYTKSVQTGIETEVLTGITDLECTITFMTEGDYRVGVRSLRTIPAVGDLPARTIDTSVIGWSSDPLIVLDGNVFGITYYIPAATTTGLRRD